MQRITKGGDIALISLSHGQQMSPRHSCCGLIASFPGHRVLRPRDACPKRFSRFFYWIPKVQMSGTGSFGLFFHVFILHSVDPRRRVSKLIWKNIFNGLSTMIGLFFFHWFFLLEVFSLFSPCGASTPTRVGDGNWWFFELFRLLLLSQMLVTSFFYFHRTTTTTR